MGDIANHNWGWFNSKMLSYKYLQSLIKSEENPDFDFSDVPTDGFALLCARHL